MAFQFFVSSDTWRFHPRNQNHSLNHSSTSLIRITSNRRTLAFISNYQCPVTDSRDLVFHASTVATRHAAQHAMINFSKNILIFLQEINCALRHFSFFLLLIWDDFSSKLVSVFSSFPLGKCVLIYRDIFILNCIRVFFPSRFEIDIATCGGTGWNLGSNYWKKTGCQSCFWL